MKAFHVSVASVDEARKILKVLADYDAFQYENNIKPDYANVAGLEVFDPDMIDPSSEYNDDGWVDWYDEDGNNIDGNP